MFTIAAHPTACIGHGFRRERFGGSCVAEIGFERTGLFSLGVRVKPTLGCHSSLLIMTMNTNLEHMDALTLFADGLALVFHEARHVRHLIKARYLDKDPWTSLISLPSNRIDAWRHLQTLRQIASTKSSAAQAAAIFEGKFNISLTALRELYENPHWRHASQVGGHAWLGITASVSALGSAIDNAEPLEINNQGNALLRAMHNNGRLANKIIILDSQIGAEPRQIWQNAVY